MATLAITLSDLNLRACACLRVRGSAHLYLFVCPDGAHFRVWWFLRMCVILLVVGSNIRFCNRRRGGIKLLSLSFLTISPHFSSFFPPLVFMCLLSFSSPIPPQRHAHSHLIYCPGYKCCDALCFMECWGLFACPKWKPHSAASYYSVNSGQNQYACVWWENVRGSAEREKRH